VRNNDTGTTYSNYRIAATLYTLETLFDVTGRTASRTDTNGKKIVDKAKTFH
jgi:hypothetical protein